MLARSAASVPVRKGAHSGIVQNLCATGSHHLVTDIICLLHNFNKLFLVSTVSLLDEKTREVFRFRWVAAG